MQLQHMVMVNICSQGGKLETDGKLTVDVLKNS